MNKLKILVCGAAFSTSGYSHHCRVILDALRTIEDKIDLYLLPYKWANSTDTFKNQEKIKWYSSLIGRTDPQMLGLFDISIQLGTPTEWRKFAKYNIGVTAGVETMQMNPQWIPLCNNMDKILTVSQFSANTILNTTLETDKVSKPVEVIHFPFMNYNEEVLDLQLKTKFNFMTIGQMAPRKNYYNLIKWFCEEFKNNEDVGLLVKTYQGGNSTPDYYSTELSIYDILENFKDRKCKVYLLHGDMTDGQIQSLYKSNNVKCFINLSHGEGFGIPIFDAVCNSIPVVSTDFGGQKDYLYQLVEEKNKKKKMKPLFQRVTCDINPVSLNHLMTDIILQGMLWAYPKENDYKYKIREVYKDYNRFKTQAEILAEIVKDKHSKDKIYQQYIDCIFKEFTLEDNNEEEIVVI